MRRAILAAALLWSASVPSVAAPQASPRPTTMAEVKAEERAGGNRPADAVKLGSVLLARTWPAQVLKVRIDGVDAHAIAGLVISGVKFHGSLDAAGFLNEVAALVEGTFAHSDVEEVDVWATVPLEVGKEVVVAGDYAHPTSRIVFSFTARRSEGPAALERLHRGEGVFWDSDWKAQLSRR